MSDVLLQYAFSVSTVLPVPTADTSMLRKVLLIAKPEDAQPAEIVECNTPAEIEALTDNTDGQQLLAGGLTRVYVLPSADLDLDTVINESLGDFYTIVISSDYTTANVEGRDFGLYNGVVAYASDNKAWLKEFRGGKNFGFYSDGNGAKNLCYAMGKLLSSPRWTNQQYIDMPFRDNVTTVGEADSLFDDGISFVITSEEFGNRLAFFGNQEAIVSPYVLKNIEILTQSEAVKFLSLNQPNYSIKQAVLLEDALNKPIIRFIEQDVITAGQVTISLIEDDFVADGEIRLTRPRALWRVKAVLLAE